MNIETPIPQWRNYPAHYSLQAHACTACKKVFYPKTYQCSCGSQLFEKIQLSGKGKLLTFTKIHNPPIQFEGQAPYCIGLIQLEENVTIMAQIADAKFSELSIGMPVQAIFRKMYADGNAGIIHYGTKFVPIL